MAGVKASLDPRKAENIFYPPDLRIATPLTSQATTVPKVPPIAQPVDKDPATTSTAKVSTATQPTNMGTTKTTFEPTQASTEKEVPRKRGYLQNHLRAFKSTKRETGVPIERN